MMAARTPANVRMASELREERAALQAFLKILQAEQDMLVQGDADGVHAQIARKTELLQKLAGYSERRRAQMQTQPRPHSAADVTAWLSGLPDAPVLVGEWQSLLELTHEARRINDANGALIAARLQSNQLALAALAAAARTGSLYGRDGHAKGVWDARRLGAA